MNSNKQIICRAWELWKNPIFLRYCTSRLRPVSLGLSLLVVMIASGFIFQLARTISMRNDMELLDSERNAIMPLLILQAVILFIFGTAQASGGMVAERDEGVIDYQRLIPMTPAAKVVGFLFGLPVREYVLFFSIMPFVAWCMWKGQVSRHAWLSLYTVVFSTAILYHLTGLVTGTIVKNRRWAFLVSIGLVFCLYTVIPQAAKFGLVFFKYLTITPVFEEVMPEFLPRNAGSAMKTAQRLFSEAKFFNLDFSESVFTLFSQTCLIITFFVMLCRKWKRYESHLMGKLWAVGFFAWVQILLLGNAIPLIDPGRLFPSMQFTQRFAFMKMHDWHPPLYEGLALVVVFGIANLIFLWILSGIITPNYETQINGWRRARKLNRTRLPLLSDESNSSFYTILIAMIGGISWYVFTYMIVESRWFLGHHAPLSLLAYFSLAMLTATTAYQFLLEKSGAKVVMLSAIFILVLPLLIATIMAVASERLAPAAVWIAGISPLSLIPLTAAKHLSISEMPAILSRAVPNAYLFWQSIYVLICIYQAVKLFIARKKLKQDSGL